MPKKLLALLLLLATVVSLWLIADGESSLPHLSELYADRETMDEIIAHRQAHDFTDVYTPMYTGLRFNGYDLFEDAGRGMLLYSLIANDPRAYDPQVEIVSMTGAKMLVEGEKISDDLIRRNGAIDVLIYTDSEYALFELRLTTLPVIALDRNPASITARHKTAMRLFDNRAEAVNHLYTTDLWIWMRGNHSTTYPKKSYRLDLYDESLGRNIRKNHVSLLGMRTDEDWILNAMYNDPDKVREVLSTNLWHDSSAGNNQWNIPNGVQYRYVEVFFDGTYWGVYALGNPVDAKQLAMQPDEHFYKKLDPYKPESVIDFSAEGPVDAYQYLGMDELNPDWEPLKRYYRTVLDENATAESLYQAADVDNAIDLYLFLNLIQGVDHAHLYGQDGVYNLYMAAKKTAFGTSMLYTPWDMDRTWGRGYDGEGPLTPEENVVIDSSIVTRLLDMGDEAMIRRVKERYRELRETLWSDEAMLSRIRMYEEQMFLSGAYEREYERWYTQPDAMIRFDPVSSLDSFADYVLKRLACMDQFIENVTE